EVLEILNLSVFRSIGAKSAQVRQECKIPMATIYRVLSELKERGYLQQSEKGDPFTITAAGIAALRGTQLSHNISDADAQLSQLSRNSHNSHDSSPTSLLSLSHTHRCESDESGNENHETRESCTTSTVSDEYQRKPREALIPYVHRLIRAKQYARALGVMEEHWTLADWTYEHQGCCEALGIQKETP
ncbi:MAG: hypothetical protein M3R24_32010, partial [Chloroflexota bacterium]|nr:hypothetical protein [Chloroflexota bacterium]